MKNEKGFTLIELLIVVAIIAIVASIAIPPVINYFKPSQGGGRGGYVGSAQ